jgi:hypothetical protein
MHLYSPSQLLLNRTTPATLHNVRPSFSLLSMLVVSCCSPFATNSARRQERGLTCGTPECHEGPKQYKTMCRIYVQMQSMANSQRPLPRLVGVLSVGIITAWPLWYIHN